MLDLTEKVQSHSSSMLEDLKYQENVRL